MKLKYGYYDVFVKTCATYPSRIAIRYYDNGDYKHYTYSELYGVCEYISQNLLQLKSNRGIIGLVSERNVIIPCLIAAVHKCSTTFMFIDPNDSIEKIAKDITFTIIITIKKNDNDSPELFGKKPDRTVKMFDMTLNFYTCDFPTKPSNRHSQFHSFIAMTSGSTGHPKHIQVPVQCLQPNIDDLTKMFKITPQDVIYFSTPLTFDPSMVEILLACINGASLLIAPDDADVLFPINSQNAITVWQTTPSRFLQYSNNDISTKILSANSTLKILALGGEPLSSFQRIKELKAWNNKTRIYTLYGVTEMSCWACVAELDLTKLNNNREIPLGKCLSETQVFVEPHPKDNNKQTGKIILVSKTRNCTILSRSSSFGGNVLKYVDTGDVGEVNGGTIYFRGRRDDIIKRFGHKVNLQFIETTIMQCPRVKTCACVWLPKPLLLFVYFSSETISSQELSDFLKCKLDEKHWPDHIMRVDNLPTNNHGKISKQLLCKMYDKNTEIPLTLDSAKVLFLRELKEVLSKSLTFDQVKDKDFFALGGTSFLALTMSNRISSIFPQFGKLILPYLLSRHKIDEIMQKVQKDIFSEDLKRKKPTKRRRSVTTIAPPATVNISKTSCLKENQFSPVQFVKLWTCDTKKCIDATPTLVLDGFTLYVVVGSHSGKIVIVDSKTGELQGTLTLKSRIEASVLHCPDVIPYGVVGAYDGTIIKFSLNPVAEQWRINIDCMIKSKGCCCDDKLYIASYDGNVRCIDITTGEVLSLIDISDQGISADLVLAKKEFVLVGTLSGVCASINTNTNIVSWRGLVGSPIFASPVLYDADKFVIFAEVNGEIHCRTVEKGIMIWKYQGAKGNIFSSIYVRRTSHIIWQMTFGCHDKMVYSLQVKNYQPTLLWKTALPSPVYPTPCGFGDRFILAASNSGKLCVISSDNGTIIGEYQLPNETFSSPVTYGDYIFIGCRNDHLYSINCVITNSSTQLIRT